MISLGYPNKISHFKLEMLLMFFILNLTVNYTNSNPFYDQQINILAWTPSIFPPIANMEKERMRKCVFNNCVVTKSEFNNKNLEFFDVILFDVIEVAKGLYFLLPRIRFEHQIYIFVSREPPSLYPLSTKLNEVFNLTWTYRLDSDITLKYIVIKNNKGIVIGPKQQMNWLDVNHMKPVSKKYQRKLRHKRKAAAWFVSHSYTPSKRHVYVKELVTELAKYHLYIDIFGDYGNQARCPKNNNDQCHGMLESDYYFYLAFENSLCEDYVTEKVLTATKHFTVPIVFGGADYNRFLPPGSYLDARALGVEKLAYIMNDTIRNRTKYVNFFKWHRYYSLHDPSESPETDEICGLCAYLNNEIKGNFRKTAYNISTYFVEESKSNNYMSQ